MMAPAKRIIALCLAGLFGFSAIIKARDRATFSEAISDFGVPEQLNRPIRTSIILAEAAGSAFLLTRKFHRLGASLLGLLSIAFTAVVANSIFHQRRPVCRCFGQFSQSPIGEWTIVRNLFLASLSGFLAFSELPAKDNDDNDEPVESSNRWLVACLALTTITVANSIGVVWILAKFGQFVDTFREPTSRLVERGDRLPDFVMSNSQTGDEYRLSQVLSEDRETVLIFAEESCSACGRLLEEMTSHAEYAVHHVVVAYRGSSHACREIARESPSIAIFCVRDGETFDRIGVDGTPSAVSVGSDLEVGGVRALGGERILEVLRNDPWRKAAEA